MPKDKRSVGDIQIISEIKDSNAIIERINIRTVLTPPIIWWDLSDVAEISDGSETVLGFLRIVPGSGVVGSGEVHVGYEG